MNRKKMYVKLDHKATHIKLLNNWRVKYIMRFTVQTVVHNF